MIGTSLGRYRVLEAIGQGGMGEVFLAEDPLLHRRVAIKVLPAEFAHDPSRRERLLHEARAASALNHPNILVIHDLGEAEGVLYLAMELVDGVTLGAWARAAPRSPADILGLLRQATAALQVAHANGLVHRDLKPANILVRKDGLLKILDFGLARSVATGGEHTATAPGTVLGTAPYMSPEQVLGQPAGPPSDLFSLGTMLYELLTGRHPFAAGSAVETMHRILHETPEPPSRLNPALGPEFDFVLAKALTKDPQRRHASAHDLDVDLETLECGCVGSTPSATEVANGPRAIAVLPFKNIGGNRDLDYLGVGLADAVITRLMDSPDLIVRSTGTIAAYEKQPVEPRRVGQELGVTAVLDASFQRAGERFRATARLVETPSGRALWAGKVDLGFDDIFAVQDQVAQGIAEALTVRLRGVSPAADHAPARRFTPSPEAYEAVLRGLESIREATREGFLRSITEFRRAVAVEPGYARAWAYLGTALHGMVDSGYEFDPDWYDQAGQANRKALDLDPEDAQAVFGSAGLHVVHGRKREAYRDLLRARRMTPNNPHVYHYIAYVFRLTNMLEEAEAAERQAIQLDPFSPWPYWTMLRLSVLRGGLEEARERLDEIRTRFPRHPRTAMFEGMFLVLSGRFGEAREHLEAFAGSFPTTSSFHFDLAFAQLQTGDRARASQGLEKQERFGRVDMDAAAATAALAGHLGDRDKAFRYLDRAAELGNDCVAIYEIPLLFDPLRTDPRWEPFLEARRRSAATLREAFLWPLPD